MLGIVVSGLSSTLRPFRAFAAGRRLLSTFALFAIVGYASEPRAQTAPACTPEMARLTSVQGDVEIRLTETQPWRPAGLDDTLCIGATIRVGTYSRAALVFTDDSTLRLDQNTTLVIRERENERRTWLEMITGAIHFFSHRPRSLKVDTPFVNAAAEGTEFLIRVGGAEAHILMFEGVVLASNEAGELRLGPDDAALIREGEKPVPEIVVRPRDAVAWTVHVLPVDNDLAAGAEPGAYPIHQQVAIKRARENNYPSALNTLNLVPPEERSARHETLFASILLNIGRIPEAEAALERALAKDPAAAGAYAQRSIIHVTRNERAQAIRDADRAVSLAPDSSTALIAQSYARQASFDLEGARDSLREATERNPNDALAFARLAEIELSFADYSRANAAADQAVLLAPDLARTQTVQGFSRLAEIETGAARTAFTRAIELYSADPLPYLGQGLAKIRDGDLEAGRRDLEIAASLDPNNGLVRSYLGKAYFEEKRGPKDATQFEIAKKLDPNDPTPLFYNAIRKQAENRPVEALRDLEKAIELNDNRAVYRSRLLLDQDLAARGVSLARIYDDLGFEQLATNEAVKSLSLDPSNYSAHRFLAEAYSKRPRHEIARASELLQSQLLQPTIVSPIQPSLSATDLNSSYGRTAYPIGESEYSSLYLRNGLQARASAIVGNNDTIGEEIATYYLWNDLAFSAGQMSSESDGFRSNNQVDHDTYNLFGQIAVSPRSSFQIEYVNRRSRFGDLEIRFDPENFSENTTFAQDQDYVRVGASFKPSNMITSLTTFTSSERSVSDFIEISPSEDFEIEDDRSSWQGETQFLISYKGFNTIIGGGYSDTDILTRFAFIDPDGTFGSEGESDEKSWNSYLYNYVTLNKNIDLTFGLSLSETENQNFTRRDISPKLGFNWQLPNNASLRLAYFRGLKRELSTETTIEPTHIVGFNQLFDEPNSTRFEAFGVGVDTSVFGELRLGTEYVKRYQKRPLIIADGSGIEDGKDVDDIIRSYVYYPLNRVASIALEPRVEWFNPDRIAINRPGDRFTVVVPGTLSLFLPNGFFSSIEASFVYQEVDRIDLDSGVQEEFQDSFVSVDTQIGWRIPSRNGTISFDVYNLLNSDIKFQDDNFRTARRRISEFVPDRSFIARATFVF